MAASEWCHRAAAAGLAAPSRWAWFPRVRGAAPPSVLEWWRSRQQHGAGSRRFLPSARSRFDDRPIARELAARLSVVGLIFGGNAGRRVKPERPSIVSKIGFASEGKRGP